MNREQYKALIESYNLSQHEAAELFGMAPRTGRHWFSKQGVVPYYVDLVFAIMKKYELTVEDIRAINRSIKR